MSDRSAAVYEHSTETLFFGRQDSMQRTSLVPIAGEGLLPAVAALLPPRPHCCRRRTAAAATLLPPRHLEAA